VFGCEKKNQKKEEKGRSGGEEERRRKGKRGKGWRGEEKEMEKWGFGRSFPEWNFLEPFSLRNKIDFYFFLLFLLFFDPKNVPKVVFA